MLSYKREAKKPSLGNWESPVHHQPGGFQTVMALACCPRVASVSEGLFELPLERTWGYFVKYGSLTSEPESKGKIQNHVHFKA